MRGPTIECRGHNRPALLVKDLPACMGAGSGVEPFASLVIHRAGGAYSPKPCLKFTPRILKLQQLWARSTFGLPPVKTPLDRLVEKGGFKSKAACELKMIRGKGLRLKGLKRGKWALLGGDCCAAAKQGKETDRSYSREFQGRRSG